MLSQVSVTVGGALVAMREDSGSLTTNVLMQYFWPSSGLSSTTAVSSSCLGFLFGPPWSSSWFVELVLGLYLGQAWKSCIGAPCSRRRGSVPLLPWCQGLPDGGSG